MNRKNPRTHPTYPFKTRQGDTLSQLGDQIVIIYCTPPPICLGKNELPMSKGLGEKISSYAGNV